MSSELWTVLIGILIGVIGRAGYAKFGGIDLHSGSSDEASDGMWASLLRDLDAQVNEFSSLKAVVAAVSSFGNLLGVQEGTIGAVIIGVWEGVLLHQVLRLSARAAAGVFAGLAGRLILDLISAPPGQAARFTASLLGICECIGILNGLLRCLAGRASKRSVCFCQKSSEAYSTKKTTGKTAR